MAPAREFTRAEVAMHTGADGSAPWIILHNMVYDVTDWLNEHPGGEAILLDNAGKDATVNFEDQGHSFSAVGLRKQYEIGALAPDEWVMWTRVFRSSETQKVTNFEFCYCYTQQCKMQLPQKWEALRNEHGIDERDGTLRIYDCNGVVVETVEALDEDRYPLRLKFIPAAPPRSSAGGKAAAGVALAAYALAALRSRPIPAVTYSKALRHVHLAMAVGTATSIASITAATKAEDTRKKEDLVDLHKKSGMFMLVALAARFYLRLHSAVPPRFPGPIALQQLEGVSHKAFYALLLLLPTSGIVYGYTGGTGVPCLGAKSKPNNEDVQTAQKALDFHRMVARVFEFLWLPFHLSVEAYHFSRGRNVYGRISPFL